MKRLIVLSVLSCLSFFSVARTNSSAEDLDNKIASKIMSNHHKMFAEFKEENFNFNLKLMKNDQELNHFSISTSTKVPGFIELSSSKSYVKTLVKKEKEVIISPDKVEDKLYVSLIPSRNVDKKIVLDVKIEGDLLFAILSHKECSLDNVVCVENNNPTQNYFNLEQVIIFKKDSEVKTIDLFSSSSESSFKANAKDTYKLVIEKVVE